MMRTRYNLSKNCHAIIAASPDSHLQRQHRFNFHHIDHRQFGRFKSSTRYGNRKSYIKTTVRETEASVDTVVLKPETKEVIPGIGKAYDCVSELMNLGFSFDDAKKVESYLKEKLPSVLKALDRATKRDIQRLCEALRTFDEASRTVRKALREKKTIPFYFLGDRKKIDEIIDSNFRAVNEAVITVESITERLNSILVGSTSAEIRGEAIKPVEDVISKHRERVMRELPKVKRAFIVHKIKEFFAYFVMFTSPIFFMVGLFIGNLKLIGITLLAAHISNKIWDTIDNQKKYGHGPEVEYRNLMGTKAFLGDLENEIKKF